jgi:hypothetical protein
MEAYGKDPSYSILASHLHLLYYVVHDVTQCIATANGNCESRCVASKCY